MTVRELIELLQKEDPDKVICRHDAVWGPDEVEHIQPDSRRIWNPELDKLEEQDVLVLQ